MSARIAALLLWAVVLATAVAWGLPLFTQPQPVPPSAALAGTPPPSGMALGRLLGEAPAEPVAVQAEVPASSRFQLVGVVAPRSGAPAGLALIAVDGKPPRAWGVGRELEPGLRVLRVAHREVDLGAGGSAPAMTLRLPPLADAQRGRPGELPAAVGGVPQVVVPLPGMGALPGGGRVPMPGMVPQMQVPQPGQLPQPQQMPQGFNAPVPATLPYQADGAPVQDGSQAMQEQAIHTQPLADRVPAPPPATAPRR